MEQINPSASTLTVFRETKHVCIDLIHTQQFLITTSIFLPLKVVKHSYIAHVFWSSTWNFIGLWVHSVKTQCVL